MERKLFCLFLFVALLATGTLFAQNMSVRGTVVDENGEPLIGASVLVKGTQTVRSPTWKEYSVSPT